MSTLAASEPSPPPLRSSSPCLSLPVISSLPLLPQKQSEDSDASGDITADMSLEHQLLSLSLGDELQDSHPHHDPLPLFIQYHQQQSRQPVHPFDRCDDLRPVAPRVPKKTKNKEKHSSANLSSPSTTTTTTTTITSSAFKSAKGKSRAFSAISKRFSPSPPQRSLSTPNAPTLASFASAAPAAAAGIDSSDVQGSEAGAGSDAGSAHPPSLVQPSEPLLGPLRDHTRCHSISGATIQDSKWPRSSCASSCSASSSTSFASCSSSCSTTSSSSSSLSSSPFFSPSALYSSLFGHNSNHSTACNNFGINPLAPISTAAELGTPSTCLASLNTSADRSAKMGATRQVRSVSCTPSFSLSSLSIPKDLALPSSSSSLSSTRRDIAADTLSPIGRDSPEGYPPLPFGGTQALVNPQLHYTNPSQSSQTNTGIQQRSSPVSPTGMFPICSPASSLAFLSTSAISPTALPPLPLFCSLSPPTSSAPFLPITLPSMVPSGEHPFTPHPTVMLGTPPLSTTTMYAGDSAGGMVTSAPAGGASLAIFHHSGGAQAPILSPYTQQPPHPHVHSSQTLTQGQFAASQDMQSFEAGSHRLEMSLPSRSNSSTPVMGFRSLMPPVSPRSASCHSDPGFLGGVRRSSKDSVDSVPGVTLDDLVDQLTIPDYVNSIEQIAKTKIFLMIYRKFLRPRELLEMFIERFEEPGEFMDYDKDHVKNTRLRICACLYYWLRNYPNDLVHRHTQQRVASFVQERISLFSCLSEIYVKLLPLSSIHHLNNWCLPQGGEHPHGNNPDSKSLFNSGLPPTPTLGLAAGSDENTDSGFYDVANANTNVNANTADVVNENEVDEDSEWGLCDEDEDLLPELKGSLSMDSLAPPPFTHPHVAIASSTTKATTTSAIAPLASAPPTTRHCFRTFPHLPRDRRSSTGSLAHTSPCAMEAFVANRRGSASSVSPSSALGTGSHSSLNPAYSGGGQVPTSFAEGDLTPLQQQQQQQQQQHQPQQQQHQPMVSIPFINKRSSSYTHKQKTQSSHSILSPGGVGGWSCAGSTFKESAEEMSVHPLQGQGKSAAAVDYMSMNTPFIEIKDAAIAAQLTCVEFGLFRKLKPRDMLRQVWKTSKGSASFQACITHFNFISSWVGTMILSPSKAKNRAKMMEKFINIAQILRDMGNFNTTMAIIGAMNTSSIHRLVQTREHLQGKEIWTTFRELEHLMSSERSFFEYRQALKVQKLPCIPYLGVHLGDLLSISEGNRDFRQDGTIHWQKFCLLTEVISTVMHFQLEPYVTIQPDPFISRVITDTHVLDDEELYTKSVDKEPGKLHHSRSLSKFNFF